MLLLQGSDPAIRIVISSTAGSRPVELELSLWSVEEGWHGRMAMAMAMAMACQDD